MTLIVLIVTGALWGWPAGPAGGAAPLTLDAAIAEALVSSPALQPALDAVEVATIREGLEQARFGFEFRPVLQLGTLQSGVRQQQAGLVASRRLPTGTELIVSSDWMQFGEAGGVQRDMGMTFTVAQSVLQAFGPAPRAALTAARRSSAGAARGVDAARRQLVLRTAASYFAIVRQQLLLEAATQARARADRLRAASEARARVGLATRLDVMRAELLAAQSQAALADGHAALERARDDLKLLLGRPLDSVLIVEADAILAADSSASAPAAALPELQADARSRRLDLQEARDRVADARRAREAARWAALPDVQITASYTRRGLGTDGHSVFNDWLGGWRAGVSASYGLHRAAATAAAASAAVGVRAAERVAADHEQAVQAEVRATHRAVARAAGAIELQQQAMTIADRQARLAALRYERGLADNVDVIDAEMNVLQARTALIGARVDFAMARLTLEYASGRLDPERYLK